MTFSNAPTMIRRAVGDNVWLARGGDARAQLERARVYDIRPEVLPGEEAVGRAMLEELESAARAKQGDLTIALLGGRGAQAMHRMLGERARSGQSSDLISRLCVFTQDALAPLPMSSGFSFVRDFERLLGREFFEQVKSFTPMHTEAADLEGELRNYVEQLEAAGGLDIFFMGHGPEPGGASHLAYIRAGSGARATDLAGLIPVSQTILDHHISKFKAGGSAVTDADEAECRGATHIMTLGPAAILGAKRIVQSIVDAETAPAKKASYRRVMETGMSPDPETLERQLDENPGLWVRLHPNVRSLVLPDVLG